MERLAILKWEWEGWLSCTEKDPNTSPYTDPLYRTLIHLPKDSMRIRKGFNKDSMRIQGDSKKDPIRIRPGFNKD